MSGSFEAIPPAGTCRRLVGLRRVARLAKGGRKEPFVALSNCGVLAGVAAPEGPTAKRARREMAPQRLEKVESAPGNGMAPAALEPQYLVAGRAATVVQKTLRLLPDGRVDGRRQQHACLGVAPGAAQPFDPAPPDPSSDLIRREESLRPLVDALRTLLEKARAAARGLRLARRRSGGEIAHRRVIVRPASAPRGANSLDRQAALLFE